VSPRWGLGPTRGEENPPDRTRNLRLAPPGFYKEQHPCQRPRADFLPDFPSCPSSPCSTFWTRAHVTFRRSHSVICMRLAITPAVCFSGERTGKREGGGGLGAGTGPLVPPPAQATPARDLAPTQAPLLVALSAQARLSRFPVSARRPHFPPPRALGSARCLEALFTVSSGSCFYSGSRRAFSRTARRWSGKRGGLFYVCWV